MTWWKIWERGGGAESPTDYYAEGLELARKERYHEALTSFRLALRERPGDTAVMEQMAVVYTRIGMTDEAIKTYRRALAESPTSPGANYGIGFLLLNRGRPREAADHLQTFLNAAPDGGEAERHVEHARQTLEWIREEQDVDLPSPPPEAPVAPSPRRDAPRDPKGTDDGAGDE